ncbi:MAG: HEPN domain-containing protein [Candidatus Hydrogenedentota bacterium]
MKQNCIDYIKYHLEEAEERIKTAKNLLEDGSYRYSLSMSYYAIFNAATALLTVKDLSSRRHSGIMALLDKEFVKQGIIDRTFSRIFSDAFYIRIDADYTKFYVASKDDAEHQIKNAEIFINEIKRILKEKYEVDV